MTLEHDIETINEYTQWKAVRQDTSPEAFVRDRAQQTAYARLSKGLEFIENFGSFDENLHWEGESDMHKQFVTDLHKMLAGE